MIPVKGSTEYLYGIKLESFWDLPYSKALEYKWHNGNKLYEELLKIGPNQSFWEREREFYVAKALKHTKKLLSEKSN